MRLVPGKYLIVPLEAGLESIPMAEQSFTNRRYALLDPTLPDEGPYRARWRLHINLDPEELKATVSR